MVVKIIEYCVNNKFIILLLTSFLIAFGIWAMYRMPLDALPDLSDVQVIIFTDWHGRSPDLIEKQITYPIVTSMLGAPRVKYTRGLSMFGESFVYVIFEEGTDIYWARSRVLEYMQGVTGRLPEGVTPTLGPDATGVGWVFEYALLDETGRHSLAELRSIQDWYLRYILQGVKGVAEVASIGGFVKQYQVNLDPIKLLSYNIPVDRIVESIRMNNNDVGGRVLEASGREYMIRGRGYIQSLEDLNDISVGVDKNGTPILLRDIANVGIGPDIRRGVVELDGKGEVVGGIVIMRYGENALNVIKRVKEKIAEIEPSLPEGVKIIPTYDRSNLILRAIDTLKKELVNLSIVVSIVVLIFILHLPSALVIICVLPVAILISFILLYYLKITANVMSLGGIAVAIGAMVDASIVLVENAHKSLERWEAEGGKGSRIKVIVDSAKEVGPSVFSSLLVLTVGFLPVFTLQAQEGRLFKPLAYTKTFAMFLSSILAITLTPVLMVLFIRGRIIPEIKNPLNRFLLTIYEPAIKKVLMFKKCTVIIAIIMLLGTVPIFMKIGSEFMPPLNEGTILYMPTTLPGISIAEASRILQIQDKIIMGFPEVERVFGKIGQARTSTDPAPLNMTETIITLKPESEWRPGMTWDKLINEMDSRLRFPGMPNIWWMPIQTRTEMLATGVRSNVGIKILGPSLDGIEKIGEEIERALRDLPGTRSIFAERVTGGYYLDFKIKRNEIARYGLSIHEVEKIIELAIGGENISQTIEGRERYPINVRYARELRDDIEKLKRVLVPTSMGAQIPIGQLAEISYTTGPPMIYNEGGFLSGIVFVDAAGRDLGSYVEEAKKKVEEKVKLPSGYHLKWAGQYEYMLRTREHLKYMLPLTLLIIFLILYMNFRSITETLIILLAIPFSLIGGTWLLYLLDYNLSVAVWVGFIALAGLDAETGVFMLMFLDEAYERMKREGRMATIGDLHQAILYGAVQRLRPKLMTVLTTIVGLVPILWSHGTGADVMKRVAAPMIGGLPFAFLFELLVMPTIYLVWKGWGMKKMDHVEP